MFNHRWWIRVGLPLSRLEIRNRFTLAELLVLTSLTNEHTPAVLRLVTSFGCLVSVVRLGEGPSMVAEQDAVAQQHPAPENPKLQNR